MKFKMDPPQIDKTRNLASLVLLVLMGLFSSYVVGQAPTFTYVGNAIPTSNGTCHQLTADVSPGQVGAIWATSKLNVSNDFSVCYTAFFGSKDQYGADGMAFVLNNDLVSSPLIGDKGGNLGFNTITPSVAIEFDCFQNLQLSDPAYDHVSLIVNGNMGTPQAGPQQLLGGNVEDNAYHDVQITYSVATHELSVYVDGLLQLQTNYNIAGALGTNFATWGFTAGCDFYYNQQSVCDITLGSCGDFCPRYEFARFTRGSIEFPSFGEPAEGNSVKYTADCGYVVAGYQPTGNYVGPSLYSKEPALIKYDDQGAILWSQIYSTFNPEITNGEFTSVVELVDGGYFIGGWVYNGDQRQGLLVKTDASGALLWSRIISNGESEIEEVIEVVPEDPMEEKLLLAVGRLDNDPLMISYHSNGVLHYNLRYPLDQLGGEPTGSGSYASAKAIDLQPITNLLNNSYIEAVILVNFYSSHAQVHGTYIMRLPAATGIIDFLSRPLIQDYIPNVEGADVKVIDIDGDSEPDSYNYVITGNMLDECNLFQGYIQENPVSNSATYSLKKIADQQGRCIEGLSIAQQADGNLLTCGILHNEGSRDVLLLNTSFDFSFITGQAIGRIGSEDEVGRSIDIDKTSETFAITGSTNHDQVLTPGRSPLLINQRWGNRLNCQPDLDFQLFSLVEGKKIIHKSNISVVAEAANLAIMLPILENPIFCLGYGLSEEPGGGSGRLDVAPEESSSTEEGQWTLYPNPVASGQNLTVELNNLSEGIVSFQITDQLGRVVSQKTNVAVANSTLLVSPPALAPGSYHLSIHSGEAVNTLLFIVR